MKDLKPYINYDLLASLDVRIGLIINTVEVEKSDKLYKLDVKFDDIILTVVSAIRESFKPEDLNGKKMPFILNLEPRVIRGIKSEAMILMAESSEKELFSLTCNSPSDASIF
jgi:methionyl-tRNA synthetase